MAARVDAMVYRSVNNGYLLSVNCVLCEKKVTKGIRSCLAPYKWYHSRCFAREKVNSCDCGTESDCSEVAFKMCSAGIEVNVREELQKDLIKAGQYIEMVKMMLQRLEFSNENKLSSEESSYVRPKKTFRPVVNKNEFHVALRNKYSILNEDSAKECEEIFCDTTNSSESATDRKCKVPGEKSLPACTTTRKKKKEILILSTSHGRGLATIMSEIQSNYKVSAITKPAAPLHEVLQDCENKVKKGVNCVIIGGGNDVYKNESRIAVRELKESLRKLQQDNVFVVSIPHRHDLMQNSCVNKEIITTNRKFKKVCKGFAQTTFIEASSSVREHFTRHGLHRNKLGKTVLAKEILQVIKTVDSRSNKYNIISLPATDFLQTGNVDVSTTVPQDGEKLEESLTTPAPSVTSDSSVEIEAAEQPSTSEAAEQQSTSEAAEQPSTSEAAEQPSTSEAAEQPTTSEAEEQEAHTEILTADTAAGPIGRSARTKRTAHKDQNFWYPEFPGPVNKEHCGALVHVNFVRVWFVRVNLIFEKAYCQYRLNQTQEALKTVNSASNLTLKLKELKAQILYRLEKYEECFDVYRDIIKNSNDDYEDEREANLSAVIANLCLEDPNRDVPELREHTYELSYNAACQLISRGQYQEAEKKLKVAEKLCRESLEEDGATEEDIEDELGIIKVQLAYCLHVQGREKEAQAIYAAALKQKPSDIGLVAIISNNVITLNKDQNVFDSKKKIKNATIDGLEHKLTSRQRKNIALNHCLLSLYTNQGDQCQQLCERLQQNYPDMGVEAALIHAVQLSKDGKTKEAANILDKCSEKHKDRQLALKLAAVQLLLTDGDLKAACKTLQKLGDATFKPGIVSALVTLYLADGNRDGASSVLKDAVDWYRKNKVSTGDLRTLWRQAAEFHLRGGEPDVAAKSLEELLRLNPGDKKTLAQLVVAYAQCDPTKAQALSKQLPPLDFTNRADVDALETSNWMMGSKVIKKAAAKVEPSPKPDTPHDELLQKKKSKRKRKPKLPKNYNPDVPPDPERWLPRHERTGYRKKKDRRNKDIGKGTQGAATGASDMYDITKMPSQQVKASPNPHGSPAPEAAGPRQQQRKVQQKKKKKGGKW